MIFSIDSSDRTATVNNVQIRHKRFAILMAENGGNLYLPDGKVVSPQ